MTTTFLKATALLTGALLLASGSAYAGSQLAKNSVGSAQVKNNSLTNKDIKDRTLGTKDLAPGTAPKTYTFIESIPEGTTEVLNIPGFSRFRFSCSSSNIGVFVQFGDADPVPTDPWQQHGVALSDIADNTPVGGATITGHAGGVGFSSAGGSPPGSGILVRGDYWGRADNLLAHGTMAWGYPGAPCLIRLQVVMERLKQANPIPHRVGAGRASVCEETGSAYCVTEVE